jgi:hypothetical protein
MFMTGYKFIIAVVGTKVIFFEASLNRLLLMYMILIIITVPLTIYIMYKYKYKYTMIVLHVLMKYKKKQIT